MKLEQTHRGEKRIFTIQESGVKITEDSSFGYHSRTIPFENITNEFNLLDKLNNDKNKFYDYDSDFKENYFKRNMDNKEFEYIRKKIISIVVFTKKNKNLIFIKLISLNFIFFILFFILFFFN